MAGLRDFAAPDLEPGVEIATRGGLNIGAGVGRLSEAQKRAIRLGFPGKQPIEPEGIRGFEDPMKPGEIPTGITPEDVLKTLDMPKRDWNQIQRDKRIAAEKEKRDARQDAFANKIVDIYQAQPEWVKDAEKATIRETLELIIAADEVIMSSPQFLPGEGRGPEETGQKTLAVIKAMAKFEISFAEGVNQLNEIQGSRPFIQQLAAFLIPGYGITKIVPAVKGGFRAFSKATDAISTAARRADDVPLGSVSEVGEGGVRVAEAGGVIPPGTRKFIIDEGSVIPEDTTTKFLPTRKNFPEIPIDDMSPLGKTLAMFERVDAGIDTTDPETFLRLQENWNDIYYGLRSLQTRVVQRGVSVQPGSDTDLITLLTNGPGAATAGAARFTAAIQEMRNVSPNFNADYVNAYIFNQHALEIFSTRGVDRVLGHLSSAADAQANLAQLASRIGPEGMAEVEAAAAILQRIYREERQRFVKSGMFTQEFADDMAAKYPWYNPIHYVDYLEGPNATAAQRSNGFSVLNNGVIGLSEKGLASDVQAPLSALRSTLVRNEVRRQQNDTAKALIKLALSDPNTEVTKVSGVRLVAEIPGGQGEDALKIFRPAGTDKIGEISFMENGVRQTYKVPDWMYRETNMLNMSVNHPTVQWVNTVNGISRTAFTQQNPGFIALNVMNDVLTAFITRGIMPHQTAMTLIRNVTGIGDNAKIMQSFELSGGRQFRFFGGDAADAAQMVMDTGGTVIRSSGDYKAWLRGAKKILPTIGEKTEQAPRISFFRRELDANLPNWRNMTSEEIAATPQAREAAAGAVELTINFSRGGHYIRSANQFVLFLNAAMEGIKLPLRSIKSNPAAQMRIAGVMTGYTSTMAYNLSFPEYFDIPEDIRRGSVVVMLPPKEKRLDGSWLPNYITIIPRTREWAFFLSPIAFIMEQLFTDNPEEFSSFAKSMVSQLSPVDKLPAPVMVNALAGSYANYDFFRQKPIVSPELQLLPKDQQTTPYVSRTIEEIANGSDVTSPLKLQHLIKNMFGGAGSTATSVTDWVINHLMPPEKNERIQNLFSDLQELTTKEERNEFMAQLPEQDRADLEELERKPKDRIPFIDPILRGFMPGRSGQLRDLGQEIAEKQTGVSTEHTTEVFKELRNLSNIQLTEQQNDDAMLQLEGKPGGISHETWRQNRRARGNHYAYILGVLATDYTDAAHFKDGGDLYFELIATVAGSQKDRRTRGQVLAVGYYSIEPSISANGEIDYAAFYDARDDYVAGLTKDDKNLLKTNLRSKSTPTEREYLQDLDLMQPYFKIISDEMKERGLTDVYNLYRNKPLKDQQKVRDNNPDFDMALKDAQGYKILWRNREENREAANLLLKWDYVGKPPDDPESIDRWASEQYQREQEGWYKVQPNVDTVQD